MLEAIASATEFINIGFYKWHADDTGWRFADALAEKSREGVTVRVIYDDVGCIDVDPLIFETMAIQGIEVHCFRPLAPWRPRWGLFGRWHRKVLLVDNRIGFCGGMNLSNDYASPEEGGEGWRDAAVSLEGISVDDLNRLFMNTWHRARGTKPELPRVAAVAAQPPGKHWVVMTSSNRLQSKIRKSYLHAIKQARRRILIANAYFLPDRRIRSALYKAVKRGIDVKIIVPRVNDIIFIHWASRYLYKKLLKRGVKIYEWTDSMLHAKTAVVDGVWSTIGSSNLDHLSLRRNLEVNAVVINTDFGATMNRQFDSDLTRCRELTLAELSELSWWEKLRSWLLYQLRSIL